MTAPIVRDLFVVFYLLATSLMSPQYKLVTYVKDLTSSVSTTRGKFFATKRFKLELIKYLVRNKILSQNQF